MMKNMKQVLMATVTAVGLFAASTSAQAVQVLNGWNLNLSVADALATDLTNINFINISGSSTVVQNVLGGSTAGQSFTDSGFFQMSTYRKELQLTNTNVSTGPNFAALIFRFDGLTGTIDASGDITFNPGSGTIRLFLDTTGDTLFNGTDVELATFALIAPSGGSNLDFFGGVSGTSTVDVTLEQLTGIAGLFTDSADNELSLTQTLHLGNVNASLDPDVSPNPNNVIDENGDGTSTIAVNNGGQYNVAVPEPTTLALLGASMIGLGIVRRKRKTA